MNDKKIIMLTGGGSSSVFMYNGLKDSFNISAVVIEEKGDKLTFLKRRIKKMGLIKVFGQVLFQLSIPRILNFTSQKRIEEIKSTYNLDHTPIPLAKVKNVVSVNSDDCLDFLGSENPDLIIVNGTRIISKKVLNFSKTTFINTHAGITPRYRGVHGGYWSIASNDKANCGVTVHLVDSGIDTGGVVLQEVIKINSEDNFITYTYLQIGEGIGLMKKAIFNFINGNLKVKEIDTSKSKLWYHPTLWFYLKKRILNGVK